MTALRMPPPRGFWRFVWSILESPRTPTVLLLWLGAGALIGLAAPFGNHPAEGVMVHLPAALLPFSLLARARRSPAGLLRVAWAVGFAVAAIGAVVSGGSSGRAQISLDQPVEAYGRPRGEAIEPVHLGGQLAASVTPDGELALRLGVGEYVAGQATLPISPAVERSLGPWVVHVNASGPGNQATLARLRVRPRGAEGPVTEIEGRPGRAYPLPAGAGGKTGELRVVAVTGSVGGGYGPAARLALKWEGGTASEWYYVDAPALDARAAVSPWTIEVAEVGADPSILLGVRRGGTDAVALVGWAIMVIALLLGVVVAGGRRTEEDA